MRKDAPILGYVLAHSQSGYTDIVRHFGLGLLEEAVRFRWNDEFYSFEERLSIRERIVDLLRVSCSIPTRRNETTIIVFNVSDREQKI